MTKIGKKLEAKIRALTKANAIIHANRLTARERETVINLLEEYWSVGIEDHLPDAVGFLHILREGQPGWVKKSDAVLAVELLSVLFPEGAEE